MRNKVAVFRKEHFNAAHRLNNEHWSEQRNLEVFGKCNLPHYHGHNYELIVQLNGVPDPETGFVMDLKVLSDLIKVKVLDRFDHKNLNLDVPDFRQLNPTAENIAIVIYNLLRPEINPDHELFVTLYETPRNFVKYPV